MEKCYDVYKLSLIGFPFFTRFYSKNVILKLVYTKYTISGKFSFWLGNVYVFFSSHHCFHLLLKTFLAPTNSFKQGILQCHDVPVLMVIPLIFLAFGSIFARYLAKM
jgi:NADH:ubiquinone oxidoreductase subunit 5 (subunit L)/multisubunit Na+/H+ antiporter MnhA subunit